MITWTCNKCSKPIEDGAGYVIVDAVEADRCEEEAVTTPVDMTDAPGRVEWEVLHAGCDPHPERSDYRVAVERMRTPAQVLHWTTHLMKTSWLRSTNWDDLLEVVAAQLDAGTPER